MCNADDVTLSIEIKSYVDFRTRLIPKKITSRFGSNTADLESFTGTIQEQPFNNTIAKTFCVKTP